MQTSAGYISHSQFCSKIRSDFFAIIRSELGFVIALVICCTNEIFWRLGFFQRRFLVVFVHELASRRFSLQFCDSHFFFLDNYSHMWVSTNDYPTKRVAKLVLVALKKHVFVEIDSQSDSARILIFQFDSRHIEESFCYSFIYFRHCQQVCLKRFCVLLNVITIHLEFSIIFV